MYISPMCSSFSLLPCGDLIFSFSLSPSLLLLFGGCGCCGRFGWCGFRTFGRGFAFLSLLALWKDKRCIKFKLQNSNSNSNSNSNCKIHIQIILFRHDSSQGLTIIGLQGTKYFHTIDCYVFKLN